MLAHNPIQSPTWAMSAKRASGPSSWLSLFECVFTGVAGCRLRTLESNQEEIPQFSQGSWEKLKKYHQSDLIAASSDVMPYITLRWGTLLQVTLEIISVSKKFRHFGDGLPHSVEPLSALPLPMLSSSGKLMGLMHNPWNLCTSFQKVRPSKSSC